MPRLALLLLVLAAACSTPTAPLPSDHPANPAAPEGPPIVLSPTLEPDAATPASAGAEPAQSGEAHEAHGAHGAHGMHGMDGMDMDGMDEMHGEDHHAH